MSRGIPMSQLISRAEEFKKVLNCDSIEFGAYTHEDWQKCLEQAQVFWKSQELSPAEFFAVIKMANTYIDKFPPIYTPGPQIDILYFIPIIPNGAFFLQAYLKSLRYFPYLRPIGANQDSWDLSEGKGQPKAVFISVIHFQHIRQLDQLIPRLEIKGVIPIIGGPPFEYDNTLRLRYRDALVPSNLDNITDLLNEYFPR